MKVMTVLGTRPEIIRLSRVMPLLDRQCDHVLVHTGQNYTRTLKDIFFGQLKIRSPDHSFDCKSTTAMEEIGKILVGCERLMEKEKPDRLLVLGDTNSGLAAVVAKRRGIPVFHMEAGNRCYDDRVPEEVNRRIIDHSSDVLMPYTERSGRNLIREGIEHEKIYVTGNPMFEVLTHYQRGISMSRIMDKLGLEKGRFFLATLHRAENVDDGKRLAKIVEGFNRIHIKHNLPIVWSVHPRTRRSLRNNAVRIKSGVSIIEPIGLFDFVKLEKNAACVLTDSGTVQEECCIFGIPSITLRDVTERPETVEVGSNVLTGADPESITRCVDIVLDRKPSWEPPREYLVKSVSDTATRIILGFHRF